MNVSVPLSIRLLPVFAALLLGSCTTYKAYREVDKPTVSDYLQRSDLELGHYIDDEKKAQAQSQQRRNLALEKYTPSRFWLGHVEFTDYGTFHDHKQLDVIERAVEGSLKAGESMFRDGVILLTYVHGWQNNAREGNGNLSHFRYLLSEAARMEQMEPLGVGGRPRGVLGVYISWRGENTPIWGLKHILTYWGRKRVAHDVGHGNMVETLARLKNIQWLVARRGGGGSPDQNVFQHCRMVTVGHSFGAAALYSAVAQPIEERFQQQYWDRRRYGTGTGEAQSNTMPLVTGMGDLVVLINPAFEALPYGPLHHMMNTNTSVHYHQDQPVLMMVLSARNDCANKVALPIGQTLGHRLRDLVPPLRSLKTEAKRRTLSLGNYEDYHTHHLDLDDHGHVVLKPDPAFFCHGPAKSEDGEYFSPERASRPLMTLRKNYSLTEHCREGSVHVSSITAEDWSSQPEYPKAPRDSPRKLPDHKQVPPAPGLLPFMVVSVDKKIINGHNDFWVKENKATYEFVSTFILAQDHAVKNAKKQEAAREEPRRQLQQRY